MMQSKSCRLGQGTQLLLVWSTKWGTQLVVWKSSSDLSTQQHSNPFPELLVCQINTIGIRTVRDVLRRWVPSVHFSTPWHFSPPSWLKRRVSKLTLCFCSYWHLLKNVRTDISLPWIYELISTATNTACFVAVTCPEDWIASRNHLFIVMLYAGLPFCGADTGSSSAQEIKPFKRHWVR